MYQFFDTLADQFGRPLLGATLQVTAFPGGGPVTIYSSNGTANPILAATVSSDVTGQVSFYIPDGAYIMTYAIKGIVYKTRSPVQVLDPLGFVSVTDTGAVNALVVSDSRLSAQKIIGLKLEVSVAVTNTGASTLTYQGDAGFPIRQPGSAPLGAGMLQAAGLARLEWDGTQWQLLSFALTGGAVGAALYPQTASEVSAGVTPLNLTYAPLRAFRYMSAAQISDVVARTALQDVTTALNNMLSVARQNGGTCTLDEGTYLVSTTLNMANLQTVHVTVQGTSHLHATGYNSAPTSGVAIYGKTGNQAVIETQGSHYVTLRDFGIFSLSTDTGRSNIGIFQGRTTVQASCQFHNFTRIGITLATNPTANAARGTIGLWNLQAEHGLFDHVAITADTPLEMMDNNFLGYTPTFGTLQSVASCALNSFRECTFLTTNTGANAKDMELSGVLSLIFLNCYYGVQSGTLTAYPVLFSSSGSNTIGNVKFYGGQCENWTGFLNVASDSRQVAIDIEFVGLGGSAQLVFIGNNNNQKFYDWDVKAGNAAGHVYNMIAVGAATGVTGYGGRLVMQNGQQQSAATLTLLGTLLQNAQSVNFPLALSATSNPLMLPAGLLALTYSASITPDCTQGNYFTITATNNTAFTINAPTNISAGMKIIIEVINTSGGALGAITWNAVFKMNAFPSPANTLSTAIEFEYNGTNWRQIGTPVAVPN